MLSVLESAGIKPPNEDCEFYDFAYENFEGFLEEAGLQYLSKVEKEKFDRALVEKDYTETIKLFKCFDAYILEGLEDLSVESVTLLEDGNIGVDVVYDIRIAFLRLKISRAEHEYHESLISSLTSLHNQEIEGDDFYYDHYVRPYYRANFTFNVKAGECQNIKFQLLVMKI